MAEVKSKCVTSATLVILTIAFALTVQGTDPKAEQALRWAEQKLKKVPALPARLRESVDDCSPRYDLKEAEEAFRRVIAKYGGTARAYVGLGECQLRSGDYGAAVNSFRKALKLSSSHAAARAGHQRVSQRLRIARSVSPQISKGSKVIQIQRFTPGKSNRLWTILSAEISDVRDAVHPFSDVRLTLFKKAQRGYRKVWQSDRLKDPQHDIDAFSDVQLYVLDLTGDGVPEVAVWKVFRGASWMPSHLDVFAWRRNRLTKILGAGSSFPLWIEDINHDGRYEIGNYYEIGWDMPGQPLWTDIYACKHGQYMLANRDFPKEFRGWTKKLREVLKDYPDDPEILKYLGIVHEIERRPKDALTAYRYASKACKARIKKETNSNFRVCLQRELNDLQRRTKKLAHRTR